MKGGKAWLSVLVLVGGGTLVAACGLIIDPDFLVAMGPDDGGVWSLDGGDAAPDGATSGCVPMGLEICDDGLDNDCNGQVDCADEACAAGFRCEDVPPTGWTAILLATNARPSCPADHRATDVRVVEGDGTITCACNCGGSCDPTITLTESSELTCAVTSATVTFQANTSACTGESFSLPSGFSNATAGNPTCQAVDAPTKNDLADGRMCTPPERTGGGCQSGQRCVRRGAAFATCIAKEGVATCPATAFIHERRIGTTATDDRACAGCSCSSSPCEVGLELWTHPNCQGSAAIEITAACAANAAISNVKAYRSTATGACTASTASTPSGAVVFENEQTVCCK